MDGFRGWLEDNPDYIDLVREILEYEKENAGEEEQSAWIRDDDYDICWGYQEMEAHPSKLHQLDVNGMLDKVADTNSTTRYSIKDRDEVEKIVNEVEAYDSQEIQEIIHDFPDPDELPDDIFDKVVGYEEVKWLLRRGLTTDKITNFLLSGEKGSAKTVFLMCIRDLEGAEFIPASDSSSAGFIETMFSAKPKYMLIDEIDDMDKKDQKSLSSYTETGIVKETKYRKTREMKTNTKTIATANNVDDVLEHIADRFTVLEFDPYTKDEFIEVCKHLLPEEEDVGKKESEDIAKAVWDVKGEGDVRQAIQVARLSRGDPEKVIGVLDEYSSERSVLGG